MTQIDYIKPFREGKWSQGYNEVGDVVRREKKANKRVSVSISKNELKKTEDKIQKIMSCLEAGQLEEADKLYLQIGRKFSPMQYLELKYEYIAKTKK